MAANLVLSSCLLTFYFSIVSPVSVSLGRLNTWNFNGLRSEEITILNSKQMKIEDLHFVDEGPAVWFMVGKEDSDDYTKEFSPLEGIIIPDEDGSCSRLKGYDDVSVVLTLPGNLKWSDFNYLSVFCVRFNHNFGYVFIPKEKLENAFRNHTGHSASIELPKYCPQDVEGREPPTDESNDNRSEFKRDDIV